MSEFANALADLLTKMDQKLDALGEQQKALDAKLERYSAYLVKKMNETSETVSNVQTAQAKLVTEKLDEVGHQVDAMERQIVGRLAPDETNNTVIARIDAAAEAVQHTVERSINLIGYHGNNLEKSLSEKAQILAQQLEESAEKTAARSDELRQDIEKSFARFDDIVLLNPQAVPETMEAEPENPEAFPENPEIAVFENPEAVPETRSLSLKQAMISEVQNERTGTAQILL